MSESRSGERLETWGEPCEHAASRATPAAAEARRPAFPPLLAAWAWWREAVLAMRPGIIAEILSNDGKGSMPKDPSAAHTGGRAAIQRRRVLTKDEEKGRGRSGLAARPLTL